MLFLFLVNSYTKLTTPDSEIFNCFFDSVTSTPVRSTQFLRMKNVIFFRCSDPTRGGAFILTGGSTIDKVCCASCSAYYYHAFLVADANISLLSVFNCPPTLRTNGDDITNYAGEDNLRNINVSHCYTTAGSAFQEHSIRSYTRKFATTQSSTLFAWNQIHDILCVASISYNNVISNRFNTGLLFLRASNAVITNSYFYGSTGKRDISKMNGGTGTISDSVVESWMKSYITCKNCTTSGKPIPMTMLKTFKCDAVLYPSVEFTLVKSHLASLIISLLTLLLDY